MKKFLSFIGYLGIVFILTHCVAQGTSQGTFSFDDQSVQGLFEAEFSWDVVRKSRTVAEGTTSLSVYEKGNPEKKVIQKQVFNLNESNAENEEYNDEKHGREFRIVRTKGLAASSTDAAYAIEAQVEKVTHIQYVNDEKLTGIQINIDVTLYKNNKRLGTYVDVVTSQQREKLESSPLDPWDPDNKSMGSTRWRLGKKPQPKD